MALVGQKKQEVIKKFQRTEKDSGSEEVQIALLSHRIKDLSTHFEKNKHDHSSRRGLLKMVSRRRRLLDYLKKKDSSKYLKIIKDLGLRK